MLKDMVQRTNKGTGRELKKQNDDFFSDMYSSMNKAFGDIVKEFGGFEVAGRDFDFNPDFDISESEHGYDIKGELSGMDEKDIEVTLEDNVLKISGEKKDEKSEKKGMYHVSERKFGQFERILALPAEVDASKIKASFNKGVLSVHVPKTEKANVNIKKIDVKSE